MKANKVISIFLISSCLAGSTVAFAQEPAGAASDNTAANQRDRNGSEPTADQQKDDRSDRAITQRIRQSITDDKSLSVYAHNVKVITQNGQVTLKGPVRSADEKRTIEAKAREVAGDNNVMSQLEIKSKR